MSAWIALGPREKDVTVTFKDSGILKSSTQLPASVARSVTRKRCVCVCVNVMTLRHVW